MATRGDLYDAIASLRHKALADYMARERSDAGRGHLLWGRLAALDEVLAIFEQAEAIPAPTADEDR